MANVNIFGNIDAMGILRHYKDEIDRYYGGDPTVRSPASGVLDKIVSKKADPYRIGYRDSDALPSYTRLVTCKDSTVGYEIRAGDTVVRDGNTYLTNTYNLTVSARNGDTLTWWGHTIVPTLTTQAVISSINKPGASKDAPPQFTQMKNTNVSFYNAGAAANEGDLMEGLRVETHATFCISCVLQGQVGEKVPYDIDILILSQALFRPPIGLVAFPIVKVVVDPVVLITE